MKQKIEVARNARKRDHVLSRSAHIPRSRALSLATLPHLRRHRANGRVYTSSLCSPSLHLCSEKKKPKARSLTLFKIARVCMR